VRRGLWTLALALALAACASGASAPGEPGARAVSAGGGALVILHPNVLVDEPGGRVFIRSGGDFEALDGASGRPVARCEDCATAPREAGQRTTAMVVGLTVRIDRQAMPQPEGEIDEVSSIVATDGAGKVRWRRELERRRLPSGR
jgi:hypothetical protein